LFEASVKVDVRKQGREIAAETSREESKEGNEHYVTKGNFSALFANEINSIAFR
jgi:hypothetical protein